MDTHDRADGAVILAVKALVNQPERTQITTNALGQKNN